MPPSLRSNDLSVEDYRSRVQTKHRRFWPALHERLKIRIQLQNTHASPTFFEMSFLHKAEIGECNLMRRHTDKQLVPTMHLCDCAYTPCVPERGVFRTEKPNSEPRYHVWPASSPPDNSWQAKHHGTGMSGLPRMQLLDSPPSEYRNTQLNKH